MAVVVLPTPPFWLVMAMMWGMVASRLWVRRACVEAPNIA